MDFASKLIGLPHLSGMSYLVHRDHHNRCSIAPYRLQIFNGPLPAKFHLMPLLYNARLTKRKAMCKLRGVGDKLFRQRAANLSELKNEQDFCDSSIWLAERE